MSVKHPVACPSDHFCRPPARSGSGDALPISLAIPSPPAPNGAMPRTVHVWSRGNPVGARACLPLAEAVPLLPPPRPLGRSVEVAFRSGER
jgi:hypothetical protein